MSTRERSALKYKPFRHFFYASCFATMAVWISRFLIGWVTWDISHSAFWVGAVSAAMLLPTIFLSPVFGVISDRINPKNGMVLTSSANMLICFSIALLYWFNLLSILPLILTATALGCVTAAQAPLRLATLPRLVTRDQMANGIGLTAILFNLSRILGPALTAVLLIHTTADLIFILSGFLFLIAALILSQIQLLDASSKKDNKSVSNELIEGLKFVLSHGGIKLIFALSLINGIVIRTLMELLPAVSGELTSGSPEELAWLTACAGGGSILGGYFISRQHSRVDRLIRFVFIALLISQLCLIPILWLQGLWSLMPVFAVTSMMMTIVGTSSQTLIQLSINREFLGRVMGIWMVIAMGSPAVGAFIIGALADWFGIPIVFFSCAVVAMVMTLYFAKYRHRLFLRESPDPVTGSLGVK